MTLKDFNFYWCVACSTRSLSSNYLSFFLSLYCEKDNYSSHNNYSLYYWLPLRVKSNKKSYFKVQDIPLTTGWEFYICRRRNLFCFLGLSSGQVVLVYVCQWWNPLEFGCGPLCAQKKANLLPAAWGKNKIWFWLPVASYKIRCVYSKGIANYFIIVKIPKP